MVTDIILRKARPEDINSMVGLISLLFSVEKDFLIDEAKQRRGLELFLEHPEGRYLLVAEYQQKVIGMCSAQLLVSTAEGGWKAMVEDVVVAKEYRGLRIGRKMISALEEWAVSQDVKRLDLLADCNNSSGLKFYDKMQWNRTNLIALQKK